MNRYHVSWDTDAALHAVIVEAQTARGAIDRALVDWDRPNDIIALRVRPHACRVCTWCEGTGIVDFGPDASDSCGTG